jgi:FkbM family methyltransferase
MPNEFVSQFVSNLVRDGYSVVTRNDDWIRFNAGPKKRAVQRLKDELALICHRFRLVPSRYDAKRLAFILENQDGFNEFYAMLGDDYSRGLMVKLLEYMVLGPRHIKLPLNTAGFWDNYDNVDRKYARKLGSRLVYGKPCPFNEYEIPWANEILKMEAPPGGVVSTFLLEQYAYRKGREVVAVKPGDVVIDGGACHGDTALYFAANAGKTGRVLSFELDAENLGILKANVERNRELGARITPLNMALWKHSGEKLFFESNGAATRVESKANARAVSEVKTVAIDDLVKMENLPSVDFIKLDIEGAELDALKGATECIKKFKPNLAVSLYHKWDDYLTIPQWVKSFGLGYRFYLDHFTIHHEETVLFATAR